MSATSFDHRQLLSQSVLFDTEWYLANNPDVAQAGVDPLHHFLECGGLEGRDPGPFFDSEKYLHLRPDVFAAGVNPLVHFLRFGLSEIGSTAEAQRYGFGPRQKAEELKKNAPTSINSGPLIVLVTHDLNIGGAPVMVLNIARWFLNHTDYRIKFIALGNGLLYDRFAELAPIEVIGTLDVDENDVSHFRKHLSDFLGEEPLFTLLNTVAAAGYLRINPYASPTIAYIHEMPKILDLHAARMEEIKKSCVHIFYDSPKVADYLRGNCGIASSQLTCRPAFIEVKEQVRTVDLADKRAARNRLGFADDGKIILACGVAHWRKQPDVFVRAAAELVGKRRRDVSFVWIGDGEDIPYVKELARSLGVADAVHFVGFKANIVDYALAADVFALTSIEDPFPLVCLDAAVCLTPTVLFREATGMTEMVEPAGQAPAGVAVTLGDEGAYFDALDALVQDDERRLELGAIGRDRVLKLYSTDRGCPEILRKCQDLVGFAPRVSVVVPAYNSEPWLQERLDSISRQTFKDVEFILLDDASTDGSLAMLQAFADEHCNARVRVEPQNGGSVFAAWKRGIDEARGDIIWLAEADDSCEPDFLRQALGGFALSGVHLVHGRSVPVTEEGKVAGDWNDLYLDRIAPGRWRASHTFPAAQEINEALGRGNTIPNASGVLVRRGSAQRAIQATGDFKLAGDWAFYVVAALGGQVAYVHEAVNYHRRHEKTVTKSIEGGQLYFQELADVQAIITHLYGRNPERDRALDRLLGDEASRFGFGGPMPQGRIPEGLPAQRTPGVLFGVGDLSGGGAQMFAIRFVNHWSKLGAPAVLFRTGHMPDHQVSVSKISPEVPVVSFAEIEEVGLDVFMRNWGLDIVTTGHWWADREIGRMMTNTDVVIPWIVTMHGCYETILEQPSEFPHWKENFAEIEKGCDCWVWLAPKNQAVFESGLIKPRRTTHIVSGVDPPSPSGLRRSDLGLPENATIFTLVSRAIESKGWYVALEALTLVKSRLAGASEPVLLLIGGGPAYDDLASRAPIQGVHLVNHTARVPDYMAVSDVGLLPSWFSGESMPLVLMEFLSQSKPAIVSDIGLCGWAIGEGSRSGVAGTIVPRDLETGTVRVEALAEAMERYLQDPGLAASQQEAAAKAFRKFNMDRMMQQYAQLFEEYV